MAEPTDSSLREEVNSPSPAEVPLLSQVLSAFAALTVSFASFLLTVLLFLLSDSPLDFFVVNKTSVGPRVISVVCAWAGAACVAFALLLIARKVSSPERFRQAAVLRSAPLVVSCFVPPLFMPRIWAGYETALLAFALAVGLGLERTGGPAWESWQEWSPISRLRERVRKPWAQRSAVLLSSVILCVLVGTYIARVGTLTNIGHFKFATMSSDLAEYDNMFFNALSGHPFRAPAIACHLEDWNTLQGHAEFGLYLLLPFYALKPQASTLLWIQTAVVALSAIPLSLLAVQRLGYFAGVAVAVCFLFMPAVQQPNFYDFHFTPLGMFFVAWLLCALYALSRSPQSRWLRSGVYALLALALLCREDIGIGITVVGGYLVFRGVLVREGLILAGVSLAYFAVMKFGVMPLVGTWWFDAIYNDIKAEGAKGFGAVILTLLSNPSFVLRTMLGEAKLLYVLHMTAPVLALWLRKPLLWMALMPGFVSTLLVTNRPPMFQATFQYTYLWLPYVLAASIMAIPKGPRSRGTLLAIVVVACALSTQRGVYPQGETIMGGFYPRNFEISEADRKKQSDFQKLVQLIPKDASVSATEAEGPHVSNRLDMFSLKYALGPEPDYLVIGSPGHGSERAHIKQALDSGKYGVVAREGQFTLVQRGAPTDKNAALYRKIGASPPRKRPGRHH